MLVTSLVCLILSVGCGAPAAQRAPDADSRSTASSEPRSTATFGPRQTSCIDRPSRCEYPDQTNTGVPLGGRLHPSGSITLAEPGEVIDGLEIRGEVNILADNVTIKNSRVIGGRGVGNPDWVIVIRPGVTRVTIQDSEIMTLPATAQDIACVLNIGDAKPTITRVNIHGCSAGISTGGGEISDSYIHDMAQVKGLSHDVGIASNGGGGLIVRHNTVLNQLAQTAAVALYQDFGPQQDNLIEGNLLAGGGYCIYGGAGEKAPTRNIRIINNRLSNTFHPNCGQYGVLASFDINDQGNEFSGNFWDETGHDVNG